MFLGQAVSWHRIITLSFGLMQKITL